MAILFEIQERPLPVYLPTLAFLSALLPFYPNSVGRVVSSPSSFLPLQTCNMANTGPTGANKPYPQEVTLDAAKAEAAQMQSEASKAHGGTIPKNDPASAARVGDP